jgi:hypothetical protein
MYHLAREGLAPDAEFESMAYYFDDEVDLARQGLGGPMARLEAELLAYLGRLEAPRPAERAAE